MHMFGTGGDGGLGRDYARGDGARERAARGRPRRRTGRSSSRARSFTATRTAWGVTCPRSVTPLARSSSDAGVGQTRCRTSQIRPPPSRGRRSFGVGGSTRRASIFTRGGDALFHAVSAWGFLPDAPDALSYPRPRAVPSRTRVRLGVSPQTTEPTRVTCATLRRVSRAR